MPGHPTPELPVPAKKSSAKPSSTSKAKKAAPKRAAPKKAAATKKAVPKKAAAKKAVAARKAVQKKVATARAAAPKAKASKPASRTKRELDIPRRLVAEPPKKPGARKSRTVIGRAPDSQAGSATKRKSPFSVGDKVVYPHHGAATILKKERIEFAGEKVEYFVLEVATDQLIVRVPVLRAVDLGVRPVISKNMARKVFATFREEPQQAGSIWSRWYKLLTVKINSGDIFQVAEVVRDLTYAKQIKGISPALKRMLAKARLIIISELRFALHLEEEDAIRRLDRALPHVEEPVEA